MAIFLHLVIFCTKFFNFSDTHILVKSNRKWQKIVDFDIIGWNFHFFMLQLGLIASQFDRISYDTQLTIFDWLGICLYFIGFEPPTSRFWRRCCFLVLWKIYDLLHICIWSCDFPKIILWTKFPSPLELSETQLYLLPLTPKNIGILTIKTIWK